LRIIIYILCLLYTFALWSQEETGAYDCEFGVVVCGSVALELDPEGVGFDEFSIPENIVPPCYAFNTNTLWFKIVVEQAGTLAFIITSEDGEADYDFAIYAANVSCTNLGEAIRCSSTNPQAAMVPAITGLNDIETDSFEGPGADGNGFLKQIDAASGDIYYMIVDRPIGNDGFTIEMTGTAVFPETPIASPIPDIITCDMDEFVDEKVEIDLEALIPGIMNNQANTEVTFHNKYDDAFIGERPEDSPFLTRKFGQEIFYRIENINSGCFDVHSFWVEVEPSVPVTLAHDLFFCENLQEAITLSTESGYAYYEWSTGEEGNNLHTISVYSAGNYTVTVTDQPGCKGVAETTVETSDVAVIEDVIINDFRQFNSNITILVSGVGEYEYAVDFPTVFQDRNSFTGYFNGFHTVYVRDKNGCGIVSKEIIVLNYSRVLTPNQDGYHDTWFIKDFNEFTGSWITIFDRYGKLLIRMSSDSRGWDGTFNGNKMPSSDYWFLVTFRDGREVRGHFALKR
jgi:gliding motility-associated-like protein